MNLEYINTPKGDMIIKLRGELDAQGCIQLRPELERITAAETNINIILDLGLVSFLDSSGIGVIVFLYKRLKAQGRTLAIFGAQAQPQELLDLLRIDTVIPISIALPENSLLEGDRA